MIPTKLAEKEGGRGEKVISTFYFIVYLIFYNKYFLKGHCGEKTGIFKSRRMRENKVASIPLNYMNNNSAVLFLKNT